MIKIKRIIISSIGALFFLYLGLSCAQSNPNYKTAVFAGGCFWCMEADFDKVKGVVKTVSGYTGGFDRHPTYKKVSRGVTGHYEAIKITYDPKRISYQQLLTVFWHNIDPTDARGQFCDKGNQYRAAIFYENPMQKKWALASKVSIERSGRFKKVYTQILPFVKFYPAEQYHQNYYKKNPLRYKFYRRTCGRDKRLEEVWGKR